MKPASMLLIFSAFSVISGCSSLSQEQCSARDWSTLGLQHGLRGYEFSKGLDIALSCNEFGVKVNNREYTAGYQRGLKSYCEPENGYAEGLKGQSYSGVCPEGAFRLAWQEGHERYRLEHRLNQIEQRLSDIRERLKDISHAIVEEPKKEKRRELERERKQLEREQKELRRERTLLAVNEERF